MKRYRIRNALKVIGDIFIPLLPGIICAGLCGAAASLISQTVPNFKEQGVWAFIYQILSLINNSMMTFLTAWAGYRAAGRFGGTPILGGMLVWTASTGLPPSWAFITARSRWIRSFAAGRAVCWQLLRGRF